MSAAIARIVELATASDQTPNAYGITPRAYAGYLLDRLAEDDREVAHRALDAAGVSL